MRDAVEGVINMIRDERSMVSMVITGKYRCGRGNSEKNLEQRRGEE